MDSASLVDFAPSAFSSARNKSCRTEFNLLDDGSESVSSRLDSVQDRELFFFLRGTADEENSGISR